MLYHGDFGVSNPLGNKVKKYKTSAFYFCLGNIPSKYKARVKDIQLAILLCPSYFIEKYSYKKILELLLSDLIILETKGISVKYENIFIIFRVQFLW